jgi:hypothetical protein
MPCTIPTSANWPFFKPFLRSRSAGVETQTQTQPRQRTHTHTHTLTHLAARAAPDHGSSPRCGSSEQQGSHPRPQNKITEVSHIPRAADGRCTAPRPRTRWQQGRLEIASRQCLTQANIRAHAHALVTRQSTANQRTHLARGFGAP